MGERLLLLSIYGVIKGATTLVTTLTGIALERIADLPPSLKRLGTF